MDSRVLHPDDIQSTLSKILSTESSFDEDSDPLEDMSVEHNQAAASVGRAVYEVNLLQLRVAMPFNTKEDDKEVQQPVLCTHRKKPRTGLRRLPASHHERFGSFPKLGWPDRC